MKKICLLLLIPVFLLFCGFTAPNNREFEYKYITSYYHVYSDNPFFFVIDDSYKFEDNYYLWTYGIYEGRFCIVCLQSVAYQTQCGYTYLYDSDGLSTVGGTSAALPFASCWRYGTDTPSSYNTLSSVPDLNSLTFSSVEDAYNYFYFSSLDSYYSTSIPDPDYSFYSASDEVVPTSDPVVPIYAESTNNQGYKMRVLCRFYNVTTYGISLSNVDPFSGLYIPIYYAKEKDRSDIYEVFGVSDLQDASVLTANMFTPYWRDYINNWYSDNSLIFEADQPISNDKFELVKSMVAGAYLSSIDVYNVTEIWVQYYKVQNGAILYGNLKHWYNKDRSGSFESDVEIPAIVNTYNPDFYTGLDNTFDNTLDPLGDNVGGNSGSGGGYINNVPNYPDYPTIKSYNHDNILVQFIETAGRLPQFFADFGSFCSSAFSFIPNFIWQIIGFGFLGSIVIMIIKVL